MGLMVPVSLQAGWQHNLDATPVSATNLGTPITANSTIHTKAATFTTIIAATTYDIYGFWLTLSNTFIAATATASLTDIAIGASTAEVVIAPDIYSGYKQNASSCMPQWMPLFIPKGSRISARCQALIASDNVDVLLQANIGTRQLMPIFVGCDVYGLDSANSRGTLHTAGNAGVESTDANIGSPTSRAYGAVGIDVGGAAITGINSMGYHFELTDGTNTLAEWYINAGSNESILGPFPPGPIVVPIPSGTQLMVQAEASGTAQQLDVMFRCYY